MGGRGATSTSYTLDGKKHVYGDEYESIMPPMGMVKFVQRRDGKATKAPTDSRTPNRIYATFNKKDGKLHSLSYIGEDGKQYKRIDFKDHRGMGIHAHDGYNGGEESPRILTPEEKNLVDQVQEHASRYRKR